MATINSKQFKIPQTLLGSLSGSITGSLFGSITGSLLGSVTGSVTGFVSVTGSLLGSVTGSIIGSASGDGSGLINLTKLGGTLTTITASIATSPSNTFSVISSSINVFNINNRAVGINTSASNYLFEVNGAGSGFSNTFNATSNNHQIYIGDGIFFNGYHMHYFGDFFKIVKEGGMSTVNFGIGTGINVTPQAYSQTYNYDTAYIPIPFFKVYSNAVPVSGDTRFVALYHNQTSSVVHAGSGSLLLSGSLIELANPVYFRNNVGIGIQTPSSSLHISGASAVLTLTPQTPLPSGVPTGSFAVSSSIPPKPYFFDGIAWNALY